MTTLSIPIEETDLKQLEAKAQEMGLESAEVLLQQTVQKLLESETNRKKRLMERVVEKNAELYRRLA